MNTLKKSTTKTMNFWFVYFVSMIFLSLNVEAANNLEDLKLLNDSSLNTIYFGTSLVNDKMQIFQSIKPSGSSWGSSSTISDPDVSVTAYNVRIDANDNILVGWIGENTNLGIYSLYIRYYVKDTTTWSPINMVSSTQNLVGNFAIAINTQTAEIVWTIYDENFAILNQSATFNL